MKPFRPACYRGQPWAYTRITSVEKGGLAPGDVQAKAAKLLAVQALSNMKVIDRC
jgi:hypothetical protein